MNSASSATAIDPGNGSTASADDRLASAYQQIAGANERLARISERVSKLDAGTAGPASRKRGTSPTQSWQRGLLGLVLAGGIAVAAFLSQSSSGDGARRLATHVGAERPGAMLRQDQAALDTQPGSPVTQSGEPRVTMAQAAATDEAGKPDTGMAVAQEPSTAQMLETIAHDIAELRQEIAQLKASQQQSASETAKSYQDIKAGQQQMAGLIAVISDQTRRLSTAPAAPTSATSGAVRRPPLAAPPRPAAHP